MKDHRRREFKRKPQQVKDRVENIRELMQRISDAEATIQICKRKLIELGIPPSQNHYTGGIE